MPTESPNTILLAQILDDLDQLINSQSEDNKNSGNEKEITVKIDGNDDVVSLLTGLGVISKKEKDVEKTSEQLESLIKIVDKLSKITPKKAEAAISAAEAVGKLADAFSKIKIDKKNIDGLDQAADFIFKLTAIKPSNIKSLTAITAMLTPEIAVQISNFIKAFKITKKEAEGVNQAMTSLYTVLQLLNAIEINRLSVQITALSKLDGGTGKKVSGFLSEVSKAGLQEKQSKLKQSQANMKMIATNIAIFIGCIAALTILTMIDLKSTLVGTGLAILVLATIIGAIYMLSKIKKPIIAGIGALRHVAIMVLALTAIIVVLGVLAMIDFGALIAGVAMTFGVLTMVIISTLLLAKSNKAIIGGLIGLVSVGKLVLMLVATIGIMMILVAIDLGALLAATGITFAILFAVVGFVALLSAIKPIINPGIKAIKGLGESIICIVGAIGIMMILMAIDMAGVWKATGMVMLIVIALVAIVRFVGGSKKRIHTATMNMKGMGKFLLMVVGAIAIMTLVIKLGGSDVWQGVAIVLGVTLAMVLMIKWIAHTKDKDLKQANITMMVITAVILVISIIALKIFIPISEQIGAVALGAGVVLGIVYVMLRLVKKLGRYKKHELIEGVTALAILAGIVLVISLVAKFLLIPIGEEWGKAATGGLVVMAIVGIMTALVKWLSTMNKEKLIEGTVALAIMAAIVGSISYITLKLLIPIGKKGGDAAIGGTVVLLTLSAMTAILLTISKIVDNKSMQKSLLYGGAVLAGITLLIFGIAEVMKPWIETCALANQHKADMGLGGLVITATLVAIGGIAFVIGAMASVYIAIGIGLGVLAGIGLLIFGIAEIMPMWIDICKTVIDNKSILEKGGKILPDILTNLVNIACDIAIAPWRMVPLLYGVKTANAVSNVLKAVDKTLTYYINMINKYAQLDKSMLTSFVAFITDDKNGFTGSIINIVDKLNEVGIWSALKASFIAAHLRPIFTTIAQFMEVVEKFANMKYVSEWDKNGKPAAYKTITPEMFKSAANAISSSFMIFLIFLGNAMKSWDHKKVWILDLMKDSLGPVMKSVALFTDAILAAVTTQIPCEWDKDGKPIKFRPFNPIEFSMAAIIISNGFTNFLNTLGPALQNMPLTATLVINMIKDGIEPVMNAVATYSDTIMQFVAGKEVEYTDDKGNTVKKLIDIDPIKFGEAGTRIATAFGEFIGNLATKFAEYSYGGEKIEIEESGMLFKDHKYAESKRGNKVGDLIAGMTGLKEVMDGVESLVNLIAKACKDMADIDLSAGVSTLTTPVIKFIEQLSTKFGTDEQIKKVDNINTGVGKLKALTTAYSANLEILQKAYQKYNADSGKMVEMMLKFVGYISYLNTMPDMTTAKKNADIICTVIKGFADAIKVYEDVTQKNDLSIIQNTETLILQSYTNIGDAYQTYITRFTQLTQKLKSEYQKNYKPTIVDAININKALYDTFVKLDNELINKRKKRNEALVELKDNIGQVANQIQKVSDGLKKAAENYQSFKQAERELDNVRQQSSTETIINNSKTVDPDKTKADTKEHKTDNKDKPKDPTEKLIEQYAAQFANQFANMFRQFLQQERSVLIFNSSNQLERQAKMKVQ